MTNILFVTSSPRGAASNSTNVAEQVLAGLVSHNPAATVVRRDLAAEPLPHVGESYLGAVFGPAEARNDEQKALVALSDKLVGEVMAADIIVIASSMVNFSITSTLKSWLDFIARAGLTFSYGANGAVGLVTGKKVVVIDAKGGIYTEGPMKPHDYQQPYLRFMLAFLGMTDVEFIPVEGMNLGPDVAAPAIAAAGEKALVTAKSLSDARKAA